MATVDLWITAGQSNMAGRGTATEAPATDPALTWEWAGGAIVALDDPGGADPYDSRTGSLLPAFAEEITRASGRPSLFVRAAVGGSALLAVNAAAGGDWSETGTRFSDSVALAQDAIAGLGAAGHTVGRVNVLWHQGENDARGVTDGYQAATEALPGRYRTALGVPDLKVYLWRLGTTVDPVAGWQIVRDAQDAAAAAGVGVAMVYTRCVDFYSLGWMNADNLHYTQPGLNEMGASGALVVAVDQGWTDWTWADLDAVWAGSTWRDFDNDPLRRA